MCLCVCTVSGAYFVLLCDSYVEFVASLYVCAM